MSVPNLGAIVPNWGTVVLYTALAVLAAQLLYTIWDNWPDGGGT